MFLYSIHVVDFLYLCCRKVRGSREKICSNVNKKKKLSFIGIVISYLTKLN